MPLFFQLPRTMGHENAGVIIEAGKGMEHWKVGDRVGLAPVMNDGDAAIETLAEAVDLTPAASRRAGAQMCALALRPE